MTPAARLATVIEALTAIDEAPAPADVVLAGFFRARRYVGSKDRAHIAGTVYRVLRCQARLEWWLDSVKLDASPRTMALADQLLNEQMPLADLHNLCDGGKYAPDAISSAEHAALKSMNGAPLEPEAMPEHVALECPMDVLPMLQAVYADRTAAVLRAMQQAATLDVRVNTLKTDKAKILKEFKAAGFDVAEGILAANALRLHGRPNLNVHPAFSTGLVEVQDEGSQMLAQMVDAQAGLRVLDMCAGAGGKTLALAAAMQNKGRIIATDVSASRLQKAKLRLRRADVQNVELQVIKDENDPWLKRHKDGFDRVLVDAPCSGTGTWRRNPETRWRPLGLETLLPLQKSILASAARLVKPGGRLVYATCSLLPEENERQVEEFLASHPLFYQQGEVMRLDPAMHATDGFFGAVLVRKEG
jgi:16S rRNA (cytosine967-C5)-methyltransferase